MLRSSNPQLSAIARVLPLGLTITTQDIFDAFLSDDTSKMFFHGHSFTGNALSCAAASANLDIFKSTDVLAQVSQLKSAHHRGIEKLKAKIELKDSRVIGGIGVIELRSDNSYGGGFSRSLFKSCLEEGLFVRALGNVVYLMPPYCTQAQEVEDAWEKITGGILCLESH
jgi:adenosylmethionine-8-amino-7-oxononanoate aminotransferase